MDRSFESADHRDGKILDRDVALSLGVDQETIRAEAELPCPLS
jgi:hypothetical protein